MGLSIQFAKVCHGVARDSHSGPRPDPKLCQLDLMPLPYGPPNDENITGYADIMDMKKLFSNSALALKQVFTITVEGGPRK
jgi:hypothetical protein